MAHDITQRLIRIIAEVLELDPADVRPQSHFFNDLGASSLDLADLAWRIEDDKTFGVTEIPTEVIEHIHCVQDLVDFIAGTQPGASAPVQPAIPAGPVPAPAPVLPPAPAVAAAPIPVVIASDHAGVGLKDVLRHFLEQRGVGVVDLGPSASTPVDYTEYAEAVARKVAQGEATLGVLVCGTGVGVSIAANKVPGARAAHAQDALTARLARQHNDANILCLGSRIIGEATAAACVEAFIKTSFSPGDDGRHQRRVEAIRALERRYGGG